MGNKFSTACTDPIILNRKILQDSLYHRLQFIFRNFSRFRHEKPSFLFQKNQIGGGLFRES